MSSAQLSRAAAEAVRMCTRVGQFADAVFVLNSLHQSQKQHSASSVKTDFEPIDFGQKVSTRLSSHCFLHALIRDGHSKLAAGYAEMMMQEGKIRIRSRTTEVILRTLCQKASKSPFQNPLLTSYITPQKSVDQALFALAICRTGDPCSEAALRILSEARRFGHRRTTIMYDNVISTCLMQGHLIIASLLFVLLVKELKSSPSVSTTEVSSAQVVEKMAHPKGPPVMPFPSPQQLGMISNRIFKALSCNKSTDEYQEALQALANIAMVVETEQLHTGRLASFIRALCSHTDTGHTVIIRTQEGHQLINAYQYFQYILKLMVEHMKKQNRPEYIRWLDVRAHNTLLNHSLRDRRSCRMANTILEHMCSTRKLKPDIVTLNILLRAGTLLRRNEVSERILSILRNAPDKTGTSSTSDEVQRPQSVVDASREDGIILPEQLSLTRAKADSMTVTSYVTHLTSTGHPHVVADLVPQFLPELVNVDHPAGPRLDPSTAQEASIQRAVAYGPHFFAAILNALVKCGKIGLAERVWILAEKAQSASWAMANEGVKPWFLTIHSYTTMMQCYGAEAKKGIPRSIDQTAQSNWRPKERHFVAGWARFVFLKKQLAENNSRSLTGRTLGVLLYRSMKNGGESILRALATARRMGAEVPKEMIPVPDERFFNAAMELFDRNPGMAPRSARRRNPGGWRRQVRHAYTRHRQGKQPKYWSAALQEVVQDMVALGYPVPPGIEYLLAGRVKTSTPTKPASHNCRKDFRPHRLNTSITRKRPHLRRID
ncbi:hypothetical protein ABKN59_000063 [Abortiporus biennis]